MKVTIPDTVMVNELGDELVLLDLASGAYFGVEGSAMAMWQAFAACGDTDAACRALESRYGIEVTTLRADLERFARELAERRLIVLEDA